VLPLSSLNRRSAAAVMCALACFFVVDWWLYGRLGFQRLFGQATQEGQVVSKAARARAMATNADVIAFGSSYIRSGLSGEPFFERGLLFWNFGVSGAGPLTSYFALKEIAPLIAARAVKPTLVFELKTEAIERRGDTLWAEYPQYLGIVRTRAERLQEAPLLYRMFREEGMTSQYLSSVILPSGIYRSYNVELVERNGRVDGYFYGMEDASGYAPLYSFASPESVDRHARSHALSRAEWLEGKVDAIRRFLQLAQSLACPVILYASPTWALGGDASAFNEVWSEVAQPFPNVSLLRTNEYGLHIRDFDSGGHPNLFGSDKLSRLLIDRAGLMGGPLESKIHSAFDVYAIPEPSSWALTGARHSASDAMSIEMEGSAVAAHPELAVSPAVNVVPDRECVLELATDLGRGRLTVQLSWHNSRTGRQEYAQTTTPVELPSYGPQGRIFLRAVPHAAEVRIEISDYGVQTGSAPAVGRIEPLRFWSNRL
jgi:hypothetical protein